MQDWQKRVVQEKKELDEKLAALRTFFLESPKFQELSDRNRALLLEQEVAMTKYSYALRERIILFTE